MRNKIMESLRLEKAQVRSLGWEKEMWDTGNGWERNTGTGNRKRTWRRGIGAFGNRDEPRAGEKNLGWARDEGNWINPGKNIPRMDPHLDQFWEGSEHLGYQAGIPERTGNAQGSPILPFQGNSLQNTLKNPWIGPKYLSLREN